MWNRVVSSCHKEYIKKIKTKIQYTVITPDGQQWKILLTIIIHEHVSKNLYKQSFWLPFVASHATNGNQKLCF